MRPGAWLAGAVLVLVLVVVVLAIAGAPGWVGWIRGPGPLPPVTAGPELGRPPAELPPYERATIATEVPPPPTDKEAAAEAARWGRALEQAIAEAEAAGYARARREAAAPPPAPAGSLSGNREIPLTPETVEYLESPTDVAAALRAGTARKLAEATLGPGPAGDTVDVGVFLPAPGAALAVIGDWHDYTPPPAPRWPRRLELELGPGLGPGGWGLGALVAYDALRTGPVTWRARGAAFLSADPAAFVLISGSWDRD